MMNPSPFVLFFVVSTSPTGVSSSSLLLHCNVSHQSISLIKPPSALLQSCASSVLFDLRFYLLLNSENFDDEDDEDEEDQQKKSRKLDQKQSDDALDHDMTYIVFRGEDFN
ncbi:hypothetical protein Bca4012_098063 [Brassica carinata]|uniref:BnaC06g04360D protein n=4 Tax=Brassica TaxID=3705 RepID=A0A078GIK2_BRANA|nr:hypothetical protein HID58_069874 [Brassica napus]CAF2055189.1 unnamed protein product [Brassica napus]CDY25211.1 BnaC06g04360D [Brassica napus]VDD60292.1 unnamed protein product [Brassica oleracea]